VTLAGFTGWLPLWWARRALRGARARRLGEPRVALDARERRQTVRPLLGWLLRPAMIPVLLFVPLFKLGDSTLGRMVKPFWVDRGYTLAEIGLISVTLGVVLTIIGALAGGWFTSRYGIFAGLLWLGLGQAISNLGYVAVAALPLPHGSIYAASVIESFTQGLGTAAFLSYLMSLCEREHAATQYALLSALFAVTRDVAGAFSGLGVERLGYPAYFAVTAALALPGLALLPLVRRTVGSESAGDA
jgi:PAT family beta-lactamase induction signal transducer AmpG